jgi:hypothetical protein
MTASFGFTAPLSISESGPRLGGSTPEDLPAPENIKQIKKKLECTPKKLEPRTPAAE